MDPSELIRLHADLVSIPSLSHQEEQIADFVQERLERSSPSCIRLGNNVIAFGSEKPRLLLNSHLDTVPSTPAWTREPHRADREDGKLYGLGSNDAKGAVAAMICAFEAAVSLGLQDVAIMLVQEEETGGAGTEVAWPYVRDELGWSPEGVIVGEPTELNIACSQSGLLVVELISRGVACHAANAQAAELPNPIFALARDLAKVPSLQLPGGISGAEKATIQPTVLTGAEARNQVPAEARAVLDLRTLPGQDHEELIAFLSAEFESEVGVRSRRLEPFACSPEGGLVRAIRAALPAAQIFHSRTMSDLVFFGGVDAVKFGPGKSARSHTSDEWIWEHELIAGGEAYLSICKEFLS
jgi:acetylornithine deacetylase